MILSHNYIIPRIVYPVLVFGGIVVHLWAVMQGWNMYLATLCPMLTAAGIITLLEFCYPYSKNWYANKNDFGNDLAFMTLVQIALPTILSFFISITLLETFKANDFSFKGLWPHSWPMLAQGILMLFIADFLGYWVHRFAHTWSLLWRFHAVHHSPHKLYWVNVGRFHPIEKTYQYLFSTLPFLVIGVHLEVLSIYFVIYGINGFFQHCNIDVKLGPLNYVFSGPELHHWHHSKKIKESNNNYGNTLIIYDLMFGTYFLPKERDVGDLGLLNRNYPLDFLSQMRAPFIKGLDKGK
jgi:sterol desaturase/sphingolipid hydroxylase (fatty acid hydroxylase superfamily)